MSEYSEWEIQRLQDLVAQQVTEIEGLKRDAEFAWDAGFEAGLDDERV